MVTVVLADCHGQPHLVSNVLDDADKRLGEYDLVFAGDLMDIGHHPLRCLNMLKERKAKLLWGNHDVATLLHRPIWPQNQFDEDMYGVLYITKDEFEVATSVDGVLISHAGLSVEHQNTREMDIEQGPEYLARELNRESLDRVYYGAGPLWFRPSQSKLSADVMQVVGHTPLTWLENSKADLTKYITVDPYCEVGFGKKRFRYAIIENGEVSVVDSNARDIKQA